MGIFRKIWLLFFRFKKNKNIKAIPEPEPKRNYEKNKYKESIKFEQSTLKKVEVLKDIGDGMGINTKIMN